MCWNENYQNDAFLSGFSFVCLLECLLPLLLPNQISYPALANMNPGALS